MVIAGGGTGGHLYPGIAVARELERRAGARVTFAGTARGLESRIIPREGFELDLIRSTGLKGKTLMTRLRGLALLPVSAVDAWQVVTRRRPAVVIGVGGYSSGPIVLAAVARRVPTLLMEQNAVPGLTNRLLARVVDAAAVTYEESVRFFGTTAFVAGNPVRQEFFKAIPVTSGGPVTVLIFGGSQGAHAINAAVAEAADVIAHAEIPIRVVHQTGDHDLEPVRDRYSRAGVVARVEPFFYEMFHEMAAADVVVCRAGATTLAEVCAAGRPSILVPLPTATDDHQRRNAEALVARGAAQVVDQRELTGLVQAIVALAKDPERRRRMAMAARTMARPDAATVIASRALQLAQS